MNWRPNTSPDIAQARAQMLKKTRGFFAARDVLEVSTPSLSRFTSTDPNIESIGVRLSDQKMYLHTSPEHFMKRLLAAGYPDIYQTCSVYRDGESGHYHMPEFTMIEWYRRDVELQAIMRETTSLVSELLAKKTFGQPPAFVSYCQAFDDALSLDPLHAEIGRLAEVVNAEARLVASLGEDRDAWLDLIMASHVAASFPGDRLTLVYHYPASQAALARICPDDSRVADRFEMYCGTIELANGFVELTDPHEQKARFESDREKRRSSGNDPYEIDHALIDALLSGMPPAAGVALGLDRLLMIDEGQDDIRSVTTFTPGA